MRPSQDDSALDLRPSISSKSTPSPLTKSMLQTPLPKLKQNISLRALPLCQKSDFKQQTYCTICFRTYSTGFRRHHCRVCANACCDECSGGKINHERACDLCYLKGASWEDVERKEKMIGVLEKMCGYLMYGRVMKGEELERVKGAMKDGEKGKGKDEGKEESGLKELRNQAMGLQEQKKNLENQLNLLVEKNKKLEEEMKNMERDDEES